jgi:hypothetical protein
MWSSGHGRKLDVVLKAEQEYTSSMSFTTPFILSFTCSGVMKICASSCEKQRTRIRPCSAPAARAVHMAQLTHTKGQVP